MAAGCERLCQGSVCFGNGKWMCLCIFFSIFPLYFLAFPFFFFLTNFGLLVFGCEYGGLRRVCILCKMY